VRVRDASPDDLTAIAGVFAHYVTNTVATFEETPPTAADWGHKLAGLRELALPFVVAAARGDVVGFAYASPWRPKPAYRHTVEDSVYLSPDWTGRGVGRLLLNTLLTRCAAAGARQMIAVIADTGNAASAALHRSCGFADAGRLVSVGFKQGRWVDTLLMQRELPMRG
jgi:phosphinothricin acetyltransferase